MLIVCNGMFRSGSTLQYNIVRNILEKMQLGHGVGYCRKAELNDKNKIKGWLNGDGYYYLKTHKIFPDSSKLIKLGKLKICYIFRDIRDVALSAKLKYGYTENSLLNSLDDAIKKFDEISCLEGILIQKYEDVTLDIMKATIEIADYLELSPSAEILQSVVDSCSLEKAKKHSQNISLKDRYLYYYKKQMEIFYMKQSKRVPSCLKSPLKTLRLPQIYRRIALSESVFSDNETQLHPDHISKNNGATGSWKNNLDEKEVDMIMDRYGNWLIKMGYI